MEGKGGAADLSLRSGAREARRDATRERARAGGPSDVSTAAAMQLRKNNRGSKPWLSAKMVKGTPGAALLKAKAVKRGASYEWQQMSSDGKTWATVGFSTRADMTVTGLSAGSTYYF